MIDKMELFNQVNFLCNNTAKQLYNLALFAIGDQFSAEKITIDAFSDAFQTIADKSNVNMFQLHCVKQIYRYSRRDNKIVTYNISDTIQKHEEDPRIVRKQNLLKLLSMQDFENRFLLLLYCHQRFSTEQISEVFNLPVFLVRKRFYHALNLACKYMDLR